MPTRRSQLKSESTAAKAGRALTPDEEVMLVELLKKKALNLDDVFDGNAAASQASSNESAGPRRSLRNRNQVAATAETTSAAQQEKALPVRKDLNTVLNSKKRPPSSPRQSDKSKAAKVTSKSKATKVASDGRKAAAASNSSAPSKSGITQFTPSAVKTVDATQVTSRPKPKPKNKSTSAAAPQSSMTTMAAAVNVTANVLTSTGSGAEEEAHAPENGRPVTTEPGLEASEDEPMTDADEMPFMAPEMDIDTDVAMSDISEHDEQLMNRHLELSDVEPVARKPSSKIGTNQAQVARASEDTDPDEDVGNETIRQLPQEEATDEENVNLEQLTPKKPSLPPRQLRRTYAVQDLQAVVTAATAAVSSNNPTTQLVSDTHNAEPKPRTAKEVQKEAKRIIETAVWDSDCSSVQDVENTEKPIRKRVTEAKSSGASRNSIGFSKYPAYMQLDLSSTTPKLLQQTLQVKSIIRQAIDEFTVEFLLTNAFPSETERLKNHREVLVKLARDANFAEMAEGIEKDLNYYKGLVGMAHKRLNNVRRNLKEAVLGSIDTLYDINKCKRLSFDDLFGTKYYIFPSDDKGGLDKAKPYLNPGLISFARNSFMTKTGYKKYLERFPVHNGKTEMHPELLALFSMLIHAALLEKVRQTSFSYMANIYHSHVKTLEVMKRAKKSQYHEIMGTFWRTAMCLDNDDDNAYIAESEQTLRFMGLESGN
ncbi:hypothetical protein F5887DRAFT_1083355 [Amanita rubescens]|nr:hypothetical protein F5887DRAFT_1083355 [Amanita rubescens]